MSNVANPVVEIYPPVLLPQSKHDEKLISGGHTCPYCSGGGLVEGERISLREYAYETCPICKGAKRLQAEVTIKWMPEHRGAF